MSIAGYMLPFLVAGSLLLGACGLGVPALQENRLDKVAGQQLVQSIGYNVICEVRNSVDHIYNNPNHPVKSTFLDTWGMQIALSLQVEEKSSINPVANWLPPSPPKAIFNLVFGGTVSADAVRQDKTNAYVTVQQIRTLGPCRPNERPGGVLLMQTDLGLEEWLRDNVTIARTGVIQFATDTSDGPLKTNVLSHEIKFDITSTGNLTPGWKLSRFSVNQSGNLLSGTRDRTNDLTITLGPTVAQQKPKLDSQGKQVTDERGNAVTVTTYAPSDPAAAAALSSQIGLAVSNAIKGTLQ